MMAARKPTMQRPLIPRSLSARGAYVHFAVAFLLSAVLPSLALFYFYRYEAGPQSLAPVQWVVAGASLVGVALAGYILLWRYPATIVRLRAYLASIVNDELPEVIDLSAREQDIEAIEIALNKVLGKLRQKLHDVQAEKIRLEDQLFQAQKLEAIGTLAAGIAHEINTPLQFASNNAQFIDKACRDLLVALEPAAAELAPETREFLRAEVPRASRQLGEAIGRIAQIVKAIREFSKGNDDESKAPVDWNRLVEATVEVTRNEWKYHAETELDLDASLPPVPCFPGEIKNTLMNLILNGVQAIVESRRQGRSGKGLIRVTTRRVGAEARLSVSDDGCGIPEAIRGRVFDPFFTTREVNAGKGCGLSFAYASVVKRHGGRIGFVTEEGKGSTFTVALPLAEASPDGKDGA
jgi:signal transduction histidine kinase